MNTPETPTGTGQVVGKRGDGQGAQGGQRGWTRERERVRRGKEKRGGGGGTAVKMTLNSKKSTNPKTKLLL